MRLVVTNKKVRLRYLFIQTFSDALHFGAFSLIIYSITTKFGNKFSIFKYSQNTFFSGPIFGSELSGRENAENFCKSFSWFFLELWRLFKNQPKETTLVSFHCTSRKNKNWLVARKWRLLPSLIDNAKKNERMCKEIRMFIQIYAFMQ